MVSSEIYEYLRTVITGVYSGECFYCKNGFSSRCAKCQLFGSPVLDGSQAEYV